jgi:protoheme IX farnesyltransferase
VAILPVFTGLGGAIYGVVSVAGGLAFLGLAWRLYRSRAGETPGEREEGLYDVKVEARAARNLFAYSILWLTALFAALLVEHGLMKGV